MDSAGLVPLALVAAVFVAAGFAKGVTGMGLPTIAMGVLGALMPPAAAAALLVVPSLATNLWQMASGPALPALVRRFWPMMLGIAAGTAAGSRLMVGAGSEWAGVGLGAALVLYAAHALRAPAHALPARLERRLSPLVGVATGLVTGATGVFVIPAVPYLQSLRLDKDMLVQALGLSFTVSTVALAAALAWRGAYRTEQLTASTLAVLPALCGLWLGQRVRRRIDARSFRICFLVLLLLLGMHLALQPVL